MIELVVDLTNGICRGICGQSLLIERVRLCVEIRRADQNAGSAQESLHCSAAT